jgi:hypothetical protein
MLLREALGRVGEAEFVEPKRHHRRGTNQEEASSARAIRSMVSKAVVIELFLAPG